MRYSKRYGLTREEYQEVAEVEQRMTDQGHHPYRRPFGAFLRQKSSAGTRGIKWQLTFAQWWRIWKNSGHWDQRGRGQNHYCMSRWGDTGPYSESNVFIQPTVKNGARHRVMNDDALPMGVNRAQRKGYFVAMRMTDGVLRYLGTFDSVEKAQKAYKENIPLPPGIKRYPSGRFGARASTTEWPCKWFGPFDTMQEAQRAYEGVA